MLNCTMAAEPGSSINDYPMFVGEATGPALEGDDANVTEAFAVYLYRGSDLGAWRVTFDPQDMPEVSSGFRYPFALGVVSPPRHHQPSRFDGSHRPTQAGVRFNGY
jgi:hypothetical protein